MCFCLKLFSTQAILTVNTFVFLLLVKKFVFFFLLWVLALSLSLQSNNICTWVLFTYPFWLLYPPFTLSVVSQISLCVCNWPSILVMLSCIDWLSTECKGSYTPSVCGRRIVLSISRQEKREILLINLIGATMLQSIDADSPLALSWGQMLAALLQRQSSWSLNDLIKGTKG